MSSIKVVLRKDKIDKAGEAPLYLRVIKNRKTKFISLSVKLQPNEWDEVKQKVKKNHKTKQSDQPGNDRKEIYRPHQFAAGGK